MSRHKRHPPGRKIQRGEGLALFPRGAEPFRVQAERVEYGKAWCCGVEDNQHHATGCEGRKLFADSEIRVLEGREQSEPGVFEPRSAACHAAYLAWVRSR